MPEQEIFTPSEAILLNGFLFAGYIDPLHAFALPLPGLQRFADEKKLAVAMITAAFFANINKGFINVKKSEHKSVLQDDPFLVSFSDKSDWPKDSLEYKLLFNNRSQSQSDISLYQTFNNIFPRPVYDSPWRDIDWDVCNGLYQRGLLNAETIELSDWVKPLKHGNRYRVGKYMPLEGYPYSEKTRRFVTSTKTLLANAESESPDLWTAVRARITDSKLMKH